MSPKTTAHPDFPAGLPRAVKKLSREVGALRFAEPVTHVYNPLEYAWEMQEAYLRRFARKGVPTLLLGMNPGPWGMAQTGVPFGEIAAVRDWLKIRGKIGQPSNPHPKRPVQGLECTRNEVSGRRLWGWAADRYAAPEDFFEHFFIWNYCPLSFMEESGRNRTPDKLPAKEREALYSICDASLGKIIGLLEPERILGIGLFAEKRARLALADHDLEFGHILHPSPASPAANRGWAEQAQAQLEEMGLGI